MKDWSCATGEHDAAEGNIYHNDRNAETENGEHMGELIFLGRGRRREEFFVFQF